MYLSVSQCKRVKIASSGTAITEGVLENLTQLVTVLCFRSHYIEFCWHDFVILLDTSVHYRSRTHLNLVKYFSHNPKLESHQNQKYA